VIYSVLPPKKSILVVIDEGVPSGKLVEVVDQARLAGAPVLVWPLKKNVISLTKVVVTIKKINRINTISIKGPISILVSS
jgi:hypothetical protein